MKVVVDEVVENYSNMLMQIAFQRTFNKSEAEDVVQETFIRLMKNLKKIKNEEHLKSWLIRVTINICNDYNKSSWNKVTSELDENVKYLDNETKEVIVQINELKPQYRDIVYLYYYQGYKTKEIAKILKMKENTVSSNLTRARETLKNILKEEGEFYE